MPSAWAINEDTGDPAYAAQELRRIAAHWMFPGVTDRFGARQGVRPHSGAVVTVAGTTWTQHDLTACVYPGLTSVSGPYTVQKPQQAGAIPAADGSQARVDGLDLQVEDDDEDASGERRAHIVYQTGTPGGGAPALTDSSLRLATILVPAGGSPTPSVATLAPWTVASGGVLPVRTTAERPAAGRYEGMMCYRQDADLLEVWDGSAWVRLANTAFPRTHIATTPITSDSSNFTTTEAVLASRTFTRVDTAVYVLYFDGHIFSSGTDEVICRLREDNGSGTVLASDHNTTDNLAAGKTYRIYRQYTASADGSKTFVITGQRLSGSNNCRLSASSQRPAYLTVDRIA